MGTRNVGCILTGLEIQENDPVYMARMLMTPIPYEGHYMVEPPLLGKFDGMQSVELLEDAPSLGLSKGDIWPPMEQEDERHGSVFVHPKIFEALRAETRYQDETLSEIVEKRLTELKEKLLDRSIWAKIAQKSPTATRDVIDAVHITKIMKDEPRGTWIGYTDAFCESLHDHDLLDNALELYGRAKYLRLAEAVLRRPLVPINWGAQELDYQARVTILDLAARIAKEQQEKWLSEE